MDLDLDLVLARHHGAAGARVAQGHSGKAEPTLAVAELGGNFLLVRNNDAHRKVRTDAPFSEES